MGKVLVIGSSGQIGTDLIDALREKKGVDNVIASDIREPQSKSEGPFLVLNAMDKEAVRKAILENDVKEVYLLAAMLSATAEQHPQKGWDLNMQSVSHLFDIAREEQNALDKIFFPSSIAVFGPTTPADNTPQQTVLEPSTVYGISKLSGELWSKYYYNRYKIDVRSIRYPGLISYKALPGGGTTDYAVQIFHDAINGKTHECFLAPYTMLPMMYMPDAIRATLELMEVPAESLTIRTSYNISGVSFTPQQIFEAIQKHIPDFKINYNPDYRQEIANSWPNSIDDSVANKDWNWKREYDLDSMVEHMLVNLKKQLKQNV
jgi:nucleoside-diphosphate-sugar epimerase